MGIDFIVSAPELAADADSEPFAAALRETIAWCLPRLDELHLDTCFRSEVLRPDLFAYQWLGTHWYPNARSLHVGAVKEIRKERARRLQERMLPPIGDFAGGRLMYFEPDVNLYHGMEYDECGGYIDRFTAPPWDTWVTWVDTSKSGLVIICWVHPALIATLGGAFDVNPEGSLGWADEHREPAVAALVP